MENFFYEEVFITDIPDLIETLAYDEEDIQALPDDWSIKCEQSNLEKIGLFTKQNLITAVLEKFMYLFDELEYRIGIDNIEKVEDRIKKALIDSAATQHLVNIIQEATPSFYYPSGKHFTVTKQDLLDSM